MEKGFTMLEVLVSVLIFSVVSSSMAPAFINHLKFNTAMEVRSGALAAAQQVLDDLRAQDPSGFPTSGSTAEEDILAGDRTYQVVATYCLNSAFCASSDTRHIKVGVSYRGRELYSVETVYTKLN